jgi:hypothetical protein
MKVWSYILGLQFLILSCMACGDLPEFSSSSFLENSKLEKQTTHAAEDACSPICNCTCCGQLLVSHEIVSYLKLPKRLILSKQKIFYNEIFSTDYFCNIWQPPKLNNNILI